jgi:hypothetical protein
MIDSALDLKAGSTSKENRQEATLSPQFLQTIEPINPKLIPVKLR